MMSGITQGHLSAYRTFAALIALMKLLIASTGVVVLVDQADSFGTTALRAVTSLDLQSRRTVAEFSIQTGIGLALLIVVSLITSQTNLELGRATVRVFQFYSVIDCCRAAHRREAIGGPSLNLWDLALAYSGLAFLLHAITG